MHKLKHMKFFIDTANLEQIKEAEALGVLDGVTTNPSLMAKEGITGQENIIQHYLDICAIVDGPVSAEVISTDFEGMIREGEVLAALHPNIVVKIPMIHDGIKALRYFSNKGIKTNCTLVFSAGQALLAAKAGATALIDAKTIAAQNRSRYETILRDRLANSSPGDQIIKMVDAVTKMYKSSVDKQLDMLKKKKVSSGWNDSATKIQRAYRDILQDFEYYLRAENNAVKGADRDKAEKLKRGDKASWSEEKYYQKEMIKYARGIQSKFKTLKADLNKVDTSKDYMDLR